MKKILIVAGASGSGKTYLVDQMIEKYPSIFKRLIQYTTRPKRTKDEDSYLFIDDSHFEVIKDSLVAKTEVNGYKYGTVLTMSAEDEKSGKIGVIIANEKGILDLFEAKNIEDYHLTTIGISNKFPSVRDDRDEEFIKNEQLSLERLVDKWFTNDTGRDYTSPYDVLEYLAGSFFLNPGISRYTFRLTPNIGWWSRVSFNDLAENDIIQIFDKMPIMNKNNNWMADEEVEKYQNHPKYIVMGEKAYIDVNEKGEVAWHINVIPYTPQKISF